MSPVTLITPNDHARMKWFPQLLLLCLIGLIASPLRAGEHSMARPVPDVVWFTGEIELIPDDPAVAASAQPEESLPSATPRLGKGFPDPRNLFRLRAQKIPAESTENDARPETKSQLLPVSLTELFLPRSSTAETPTPAVPEAGEPRLPIEIPPVERSPELAIQHLPPTADAVPQAGCCEVEPASTVPLPKVRFPHLGKLFRR